MTSGSERHGEVDLAKAAEGLAPIARSMGLEPEELVARLQAEAEIARAEGIRQTQLGDDEPEFVIVGMRRPGGVVLFASNAVINAKFGRRVDGFDKVSFPGAPRPAMVPRIRAVVGVEMTSFEQILGSDYPSALRSLLGRGALLALEEGHGEPQP